MKWDQIEEEWATMIRRIRADRPGAWVDVVPPGWDGHGTSPLSGPAPGPSEPENVPARGDLPFLP